PRPRDPRVRAGGRAHQLRRDRARAEGAARAAALRVPAAGADRRAAQPRLTVSWRIRGSYFESCNCDPICPCRRIDGVAGGRSTFGECLGLLSWVIEHGHTDGVALDGLAVALASRYHDDEPGSPWGYVLYAHQPPPPPHPP